jgi:hypothetical protein
MKNLAVVLVLVLVLAFGILALLVFGTKSATQSIPVPVTNTSTPATENNSAAAPLPASGSESPSSILNSPSSPSATLTRPNLKSAPAEPPPTAAPLPPLTILDNARVMIHNYHDRFGENPVGNNAEITAALLGKNPKQVTFITEESGLHTNDQGELLDGWGTPFFFHQVSSKEMEIRSAGEDRKLWTFDDLVTR